VDFGFTVEQQALRDSARRLAEAKFADRAFRRDGFAWDSLKVLAEAGYTGLTLSEADGGQGATLLDAMIVMEAVSAVCPHSGDALQATNFGAIRQVAAYGSESLKKELLPPLLSGDALISAGMSEPDAGSALTDLRTQARYDGADVVINGGKIWNSHGPEVTHVVVWCRFGPKSKDIGAVVVPADRPGFRRGRTETYMSGERHAALYFDDCRVPRANVLTDHDGVKKMMTTFGIERMGNAIRAIALAQSAFDRAVEHAKTRSQFGRPLCEFQGIQWKFADMKVQLDAARLLAYRAVANADAGAPEPAEAAIAKLYANETAFRVANEALQIFGASGYTQGSPMEYIVRRTRGWMIAGGSVEMLRSRIAESVFDRRFSQRREPGR
jgi:alkylation response protein AidB-like acyl-CoA dehydrogenase